MAWAAHNIGRTYRDYYLDHRVLLQAQLALADLLPIDQVSVISDPFRESTGFGAEFDWPAEGVGVPRHPLPLVRESTLRSFDVHAAPRTRDRIDAVASLRQAVGDRLSVLGWVEGPLAEYADLRGLDLTMMDLLDEPDRFDNASDAILVCAIRFARAQIEAGADMIGVGDAACSLVSTEVYTTHIQPLHRRLFAAIHDAGATVKLHVCGNIRHLLPHFAATGADVIDVDWMVPLAEARRQVGDAVTLAGNLDPVSVVMRGQPSEIVATARQCSIDAGSRHLLQAGCEIPPGTPLVNVQAMTEAHRN
jgi:MtaA/CmuA family methyltransferase